LVTSAAHSNVPVEVPYSTFSIAPTQLIYKLCAKSGTGIFCNSGKIKIPSPQARGILLTVEFAGFMLSLFLGITFPVSLVSDIFAQG
jgi:hypothetical protein